MVGHTTACSAPSWSSWVPGGMVYGFPGSVVHAGPRIFPWGVLGGPVLGGRGWGTHGGGQNELLHGTSHFLGMGLWVFGGVRCVWGEVGPNE